PRAAVGGGGGAAPAPPARPAPPAPPAGVAPALQRGVVRPGDPLPPVAGDVADTPPLPTDDDVAALGERDGAELGDDLAADVVAVGAVDQHLDVDERAVGALEEDDERVLQVD